MGAFHLLALEDNEEYQKVLRSMLSKYPGRSRLDVDIISGVTTFEALMASDDRIDIFITDIDLGEGNPSGIELVRRYFPAGSPTKVIYISGHVEFCTSVYQTEHTYFLLKPINQSDFDAALDKALSNLQDSRQLPRRHSAQRHGNHGRPLRGGVRGKRAPQGAPALRARGMH